MDLQQLRYPIGEFNAPNNISSEHIEQWIEDIKSFPKQLLMYSAPLSKEQLNWQYRKNGWTIKQVIHHCADSHMNSFIRFKLALTEKQPTIRPYFEDRWAELTDGLDDDITSSLLLLKALHSKWSKLLKDLTQEQLEMTFIHPESGAKTSVKENIGIYAWHGKHHVEHIILAIENEGKVTF